MISLRRRKDLEAFNDTITDLLELYNQVTIREWREAFLSIDVEVYDKLMELFHSSGSSQCRFSELYTSCIRNTRILVTCLDYVDRRHSSRYQKKLAKYLIAENAHPYTPYKSAFNSTGLKYLDTHTEDEFPLFYEELSEYYDNTN